VTARENEELLDELEVIGIALPAEERLAEPTSRSS
jgi:hypothetical protein